MRPQVIRVTERIFCVRQLSYLTCSYIVRAGAGLVLVDAGMKSDGSDMLHGLRELGASAREIRAILLTHWHGDHSAGAAALQRLSGAPVFFGAGEGAYFSGEKAIAGVRGTAAELVPEWGPLVLLKGVLGNSSPTPIAGGTEVRGGELLLGEFRAIATPGHTEGHVSYFHEPERALFAGDALAVVGGEIRRMARAVTPDPEQARASMIRCLEQDFAHMCPGHRGPLSGAPALKLLAELRSGGRWPLLG